MMQLAISVLRRCRSFGRETKGAAAVEFAILGTVLFFIVGGVLDFGHAFYIRQVVTNASKEGARYGIAQQIYTTSMRKPPSAFSPTIASYITTILTGTGITATTTPSGTGYSSGVSGDPLTVTVTATKTWWMLGTFFGSATKTIAATTTMRLE